jgi:hypothetical protein
MTKVAFAVISASVLGIDVALIAYRSQYPMSVISCVPIWSVTMAGIFFGFLALFAAIDDATKKK